MQENKRQLLCTNPIGQSLIQKAEEKGIAITVLPFIEMEFLQLDELKEIIEPLSRRAITVAFTSVNAVETVKNYLSGAIPYWKIWSTGGATEKTVREYFGKGAISGTGHSATELAEAMIDFGVTEEVVFFCGNQRREELPGKLQGHGIRVKEIIVYKTAASAQKISKHYDGISFFSPSAVDSFFSVNQIDPATVLFAIGKTTADRIRTYSKNKVIVGDTPGKQMLIEEAISYFQTHPVPH
jgi:uroporphyrinogen-III synthase